jgi:hypothetical protein
VVAVHRPLITPLPNLSQLLEVTWDVCISDFAWMSESN